MVTTAARHKVDDHFENREPALRETYDAILTASRRLGHVTEEPKKTSIHLVRKTAFTGVAVHKSALVLTLKSATDIRSPRITKTRRWSCG